VARGNCRGIQAEEGPGKSGLSRILPKGSMALSHKISKKWNRIRKKNEIQQEFETLIKFTDI